MTVRLFVAIDLDEGARQAIARTQTAIARGVYQHRSLKWVDPVHLHLTLVFLGEVADTAVPPVIEALGSPLAVHPFAAVLGGLGVFPPRGAPQVLWLGVEKGADRIVEVQRMIASRLACLGVPPEQRPYHPHLTLARWRPSRGPRHHGDRRRPRLPRALDLGTSVARVDVDWVTLYRSRLSPAGPTYTPLARATLT